MSYVPRKNFEPLNGFSRLHAALHNFFVHHRNCTHQGSTTFVDTVDHFVVFMSKWIAWCLHRFTKQGLRNSLVTAGLALRIYLIFIVCLCCKYRIMNFEMIWVWVIDTDSFAQNYPGYDKINLIPVDKELRDQYFVTGSSRQQCLLYGQLVLRPAKPASHPVILLQST